MTPKIPFSEIKVFGWHTEKTDNFTYENVYN